MKLKYLILIAIIATASLYVYKDKTLRSQLLGLTHQVAPELNHSTLYKWKNNNGQWQVTDIPPSKGISYTTISSQDQINVIPGAQKQKNNTQN